MMNLIKIIWYKIKIIIKFYLMLDYNVMGVVKRNKKIKNNCINGKRRPF